MVAAFSPHRDAGGTLHLASHSSIHHVDASTAIRQLRRSLSRSPSKSPSFNFLSAARTHSPTKQTAYISSPLSPSRKPAQSNFVLFSACNQSAGAATYPSSTKISRPVMRRARTSPRSPVKRVLHISTDQGNSTPLLSASEAANGQENSIRPLTPTVTVQGDDPTDDVSGWNSPSFSGDPALAPRTTLSRIEKRRSATFNSCAAVSPLKRSDGIMGLDQASLGSPSAKRRSLHAAALAAEFNIFDHDKAVGAAAAAEESTDAATKTVETDAPQSSYSPVSPFSPFSTVPKRSSSLRRSTLQQRQSERSLFARSRGCGGEVPASPGPGSPLTIRPRLSLDHTIFQPDGGPLSSPKAPTGAPVFATAAPHVPHPLSRTITQSSSGSSLMDESPTHEPIHKAERPRAVIDFSKSLPAGATRPTLPRKLTREDSTSSTDSFATPENYKLVKPLPAAFMSTGLISKKNRNAEDPHQLSGFMKNMPDTPCKRPINLFPTGPKAVPDYPVDRPRLVRQSPLAAPSPFNPSASTLPKSGPFARSTGIFGSAFNPRPGLSRRGSFVSVDGDEQASSHSPSGRPGSQPLSESDFPPTPTKQSFFPSRTYPPASTQITSLERLAEGKGVNSSPLHDRFQAASPHTPHDSLFPDPSGLSISNEHHLNPLDLDLSNVPATPTGPRDSFPPPGKRPSLPLAAYHTPDVDPSLTARFDKVELVGTGEFSQVYRVAQPPPADDSITSIFSLPSNGSRSPQSIPDRVWAVKKSKHPFTGPRDRERRMREVEILKRLTPSDHVISLVDHWEDHGHLYIQTEYCEEGSLDVFLAQVGLKARLDDFRIWKILLELALGVKHIHDSGFIHLDLKPANVLITFEGVLKIADFGMATTWPAEQGIDGEGDREYIGPEILMGRYDKPADIFSLGLIIFEIAGNVELPDNGLSWQKLRNGDMSDVPSLTWSSETSIFRDASGNPVHEESSFEELCGSDFGDDRFGDVVFMGSGSASAKARDRRQPVPLSRSGELVNPPDFMTDANHPQALDKIVRWMISPEPADRPTADQLLETFGVQFAERRRRAGATVYEGNWGPADDILAEDAEMIDV